MSVDDVVRNLATNCPHHVMYEIGRQETLKPDEYLLLGNCARCHTTKVIDNNYQMQGEIGKNEYWLMVHSMKEGRFVKTLGRIYIRTEE